jgi:hypothetical protein
MGEPDACVKQLRVSLPPEIEQAHIEEVYAEMQIARRDAAEAAEEDAEA